MTDTIATLKQQLLELKASHASGAVSDGQYEAQRAALEKSLLEKVMQDGGAFAAWDRDRRMPLPPRLQAGRSTPSARKSSW